MNLTYTKRTKNNGSPKVTLSDVAQENIDVIIMAGVPPYATLCVNHHGRIVLADARKIPFLQSVPCFSLELGVHVAETLKKEILIAAEDNLLVDVDAILENVSQRFQALQGASMKFTQNPDYTEELEAIPLQLTKPTHSIQRRILVWRLKQYAAENMEAAEAFQKTGTEIGAMLAYKKVTPQLLQEWAQELEEFYQWLTAFFGDELNALYEYATTSDPVHIQKEIALELVLKHLPKLG